MRSTAQSILGSSLLLGACVLALAPAVVLAHGDDEPTNMDGMGGMGAVDAVSTNTTDAPKPEASYPPTYFAHPEHRGMMYAHILLMTLGWVFALPAAVMLSLARSRYTLPVQLAFLATNAGGVFFSVVYNASTPDLYPNNAHHKVGWIATAVVSAQVVVGLLARIAGAMKGDDARSGTGSGSGSNGGSNHENGVSSGERRAFIPVSTAALAEHHHRHHHHRRNSSSAYRMSNDSGQGTEPNTESLRSNSVSTLDADAERQKEGYDDRVDPNRRGGLDPYDDNDDNDDDDEFEDEDLEVARHPPASSLRARSGRMYAVANKVAGKISSRAWRVLLFGYNFVDRTILILGFIAFTLGIIAYGRFFEGHGIFSGLAHWIKGGIFFWLGIFTLGRWAGCFGEWGWAWNVRPKSSSQKWRPSAEFVESALIFFYGSTNVFLEHLGNAGKEYTPQDLEHISITILFIGGGLCGMLIESTRIRDLLNTTVTEAVQEHSEHNYHDVERETLRPPRHYEFSVNPIPALVILLLGIMMSSHTQHSMISSMVHKQWGNLLTGASFARGFSYVLIYLRPPKSVLPSRPPTELLTSFGLISGGVIFMASSSDTVDGMIHYHLDAMLMYTITMGLVGLLMSWVILVIALKGWALRKELGRPAGSYRLS
ncbi:integral membrane protein [Niveomyces insectorum RCEF 264]|uniref:Integral membrane protein n=1 Tax=Niveomyces insectorum RCEF 264 TaxID=1081102 RepID=A0A162MDX0_9HYPO|nr:integral membrane protein [Niveomyces insectorum RCEF 264]